MMDIYKAHDNILDNDTVHDNNSVTYSKDLNVHTNKDPELLSGMCYSHSQPVTPQI